MDFLGIGPLELFFIVIISLLVFGPSDMVKAGRTIGRYLRKLVKSPLWQEVTRLRHLPNKLIREAGLDEELDEINKGLQSLKKPSSILDDVEKDLKDAAGDFSDWTVPIPDLNIPDDEAAEEGAEPAPEVDPKAEVDPEAAPPTDEADQPQETPEIESNEVNEVDQPDS